MADKPSQFQMAYDAGQDRLLLRINTTHYAEYRLWLTRRVVRGLWDGLLKVIQVSAKKDAPAETEKREAILEFDHQTAVEQADFKTPYKEAAASYPLGEDGELVTGLGLGRDSGGMYKLKLNTTGGKGVNLNFDDRLLHSFMKLLIDSSGHAEWGLDLQLPTAGVHNDAASSVPDKRLRH